MRGEKTEVCDVVRDTELAQTRSGLARLCSLHEAGPPSPEKGEHSKAERRRWGGEGKENKYFNWTTCPESMSRINGTGMGGENPLGLWRGSPPRGRKQHDPGQVPLLGPQ